MEEDSCLCFDQSGSASNGPSMPPTALRKELKDAPTVPQHASSITNKKTTPPAPSPAIDMESAYLPIEKFLREDIVNKERCEYELPSNDRIPLIAAKRTYDERAYWFWHHWVQSQGDEWHDDYLNRMNPISRLNPVIAARIPADAKFVSILDVGSCPLTSMGQTFDNVPVQIYAVDTLADSYNMAFNKFGIRPPVLPMNADAERLHSKLPESYFHITMARHVSSAMMELHNAIIEMLYVTKVGGYVIIETNENEATNSRKERDLGMQTTQFLWDIYVESGTNDVAIRPLFDVSKSVRAGVAISLNKRLAGYVEVEIVSRSSVPSNNPDIVKGVIMLALKKIRDIPPNLLLK
ncbi:hypothetical protein HK102_001709 [Quaeritorhiza haematococci]|nr:hypothetical protein HK102_001709 [Quaeritorhiza haematococci]